MAVYIYTVSITAQKDGGKYKHKLFEFTNKQSALTAVKRLAKEMEIITGEKPYKLSGDSDDYIHLCHLGKDYYCVTCNQAPAATLNNSNADLNFNFKNDEED